MFSNLKSVLLGVFLAGASLASTYDPSTVLILVNDQVLPEAHTNGVGASIYVGQYYATKRGIPAANIVHLSIPLGCCTSDPGAYDSWTITWPNFVNYIRTPLKNYLETNNLQRKIKYIVPIYGIPTHLANLGVPLPPNQNNVFFPIEAYSIDSFLAAMYSGSDYPWMANPYAVSDPTYFKAPIRNWVNPAGWPFYLVARLDGPSSDIAMGLVDKAIQAEAGLTKTAGTGYFDWQNSTNFGDQSMKNAYTIAVNKGLPSVLNDQAK